LIATALYDEWNVDAHKVISIHHYRLPLPYLLVPVRGSFSTKSKYNDMMIAAAKDVLTSRVRRREVRVEEREEVLEEEMVMVGRGGQGGALGSLFHALQLDEIAGDGSVGEDMETLAGEGFVGEPRAEELGSEQGKEEAETQDEEQRDGDGGDGRGSEVRDRHRHRHRRFLQLHLCCYVHSLELV
jgi:hypothetical protein